MLFDYSQSFQLLLILFSRQTLYGLAQVCPSSAIKMKKPNVKFPVYGIKKPISMYSYRPERNQPCRNYAFAVEMSMSITWLPVTRRYFSHVTFR